MKQQIAELEKKKKEVLAELQKQQKHRLNLTKEQKNLEGEKEKFITVHKQNEDYKKQVEQKIARLTAWREFIKKVHLTLLADENIFKKRQSILNDLKTTKSLVALYDKLIQLDCLKNLGSAAMKESVVSNDDPLWREELNAVLWDVLADPKITLDEVNNKYLVRGSNVSWEQLAIQLEDDIKKRIALYGLSFTNDSNKNIVVTNANLLGQLNDLPIQLKNIINHHIERVYPYYSVNKQATWPEKSKGFDEAKTIVESLQINYYDILKSYAETVETVVGHHLYLDGDINSRY